MTLTHTPTLTLSTALEAFAVRLESRDEGAWQTLLSQVNPVFGDPIAAQVAHLMQTYKDDGEYDSELIRTDSGRIGGWDGGEDSDEDELAWTARRTRYLESLDKNVLIDMINMPEYERDDLIGDNM
jgi:hypothetical protein